MERARSMTVRADGVLNEISSKPMAMLLPTIWPIVIRSCLLIQ